MGLSLSYTLDGTRLIFDSIFPPSDPGHITVIVFSPLSGIILVLLMNCVPK